MVLIGTVHTNAFSHENAYNYMRFCTLDISKCMCSQTRTQECGRCCKDRPISMVVLQVFRGSKRDAGGGVGGWVGGSKMAVLA